MSKEIQQIIEKLETLAPGEEAVLATVVEVRGSSYRLPGAKMLILANGDTFGTVSGGCLEADVLERARKVRQTGEPSVFTYDTTGDENSVFSLNMGCRGVIRILLESVKKDHILFRAIKIAAEYRYPLLTATLISTDTDLPIGGRIFYDEQEQFNFIDFPTNSDFHEQLIKDCEMLYDANAGSLLNTYPTERGNYEIFFEVTSPPLNLFLFGAGNDAIPLAALAKNLGWRVTLIDHRAAWATPERFPQADRIVISRPEGLKENLFYDKHSAAVVMSHNYEHDREILSRLLKLECLYIGALGPKRRTENLLYDLQMRDEKFSAQQLKKLHAPVGLDIGADTPEAIALSILAEIQAVLKNREGGFLRERQGSIYGRHSLD